VRLKKSTTAAQTEALVNEYKGHLFEYLVAAELSRELCIETAFLEHFGGSTKERLLYYEQWLKDFDRTLIQQLKNWSGQVVLDLKASDSFTSVLSTKWTHIYLLGKDSQGSGHEFGEADILLQTLSDPHGEMKSLGLSLKLYKDQGAINTKSAGLKSFLTKYFAPFDTVFIDQKILDEKGSEIFHELAEDFYEMAGLPILSAKPFGNDWTQAGLEVLPGKLPKAFQERLYQSYYERILPLKNFLISYSKKDPELFADCLKPLCGFASENLIQLNARHFSDGTLKTEVLTFTALNETLKDFRFIDDKQNPDQVTVKSSFEIDLGVRILQIRLKPMNQFTQEAYKINCSLKRKEVER
jgi:hypothetical protein